MELNHLFSKKDDWQCKTFKKMKEELVSAKGNRFLRYDNAKESHLVVIYGKSQVGKTTLILNMMGLEEDYIPEVYETLRAGVPRGNSSTSTAIIYAKSSKEKYGCAFVSSKSSSKDVEYYDKEGMKSRIGELRREVEQNKGPQSILYIYIPKNYFIRDYASDCISIMDMPGVESRNHKEDLHVQNLMTKYIPISSVCIIACRANEIQSLETLVLPNQLDWKRMEHRFILVITHAYNDGTTKQFFKNSPSERKSGFYDYVVNAYKQEIRGILGAENKTEVYPVDIGDTLLKLCSEEIQNDADRDEIKATKNQVLSELRKSIIARKGERLKSALKDLKVLVEHYGRDEIQNIKEEIEDIKNRIEEKKESIRRAEDLIERLGENEGEIADINAEINEMNAIIMQNFSVSNISSDVKMFIKDNSLSKEHHKVDYLKDKEEKVLKKIFENVSVSVGNIIKKFNDLLDNANIEDTLDLVKIQDEASEIVVQKHDEIYPPRKGLIPKKVRLEEIEIICNSIEWNVFGIVKNYVDSCKSKVLNSIEEKEKKKEQILATIQKQQEKCRKNHENIDQFNDEINKLKSQIEEITNTKERDMKTFDEKFLKYANEAFWEQRKLVVEKINKSENADDNMLLILFLGLLDKDYQKVLGGQL